MFMRLGKAVRASRPIAAVWLGVMFTDTAGLTDACILRPRNRDATSQNGPRNDIDNQNQSQQYQPGSPRLPMPVLVRGAGKRENPPGKRGCGWVPPGLQ